jgi:hypothetical protein
MRVRSVCRRGSDEHVTPGPRKSLSPSSARQLGNRVCLCNQSQQVFQNQTYGCLSPVRSAFFGTNPRDARISPDRVALREVPTTL